MINAGVMLTFVMVADEVHPRGGFEKSFSTHSCRADIYCAFHIHQMLHCRANWGPSLTTSDVEQQFMEPNAELLEWTQGSDQLPFEWCISFDNRDPLLFSIK